MPDKRVTVWIQRFKDRAPLVLQWIDPETGRRKSRSAQTADPKEAEKARADLEYELNHGRYQEASRMTWERFRELFESEYVASRRLNTQLGYRATLDAFEALSEPTRLRGISERTISLFATSLREGDASSGRKPMKQSTIKVRLQLLRSCLRWAADQRMIAECPRFPAIKVPRKRPQPVPQESFERLYEKAPDQQTKAFLLCGWLAGLRRSEALALEREHTEEAPYLNLAHDRIILPAEFAKAVEDQWIPLDPNLRDALLSLPVKGTKFFYFTAQDGHELTASAVGQKVRALAAQAGVKLTVHALRRGFGCRHAGRVPCQVLQRLMRHKNIATTMEFYANIDEAVVEAILGSERNGLRNKEPDSAGGISATSDESPYDERRNV